MKHFPLLVAVICSVVLALGCGEGNRPRLLAVDGVPSSATSVASDRVLFGVYSGGEGLYGINPQTGETVNISASSVPTFKAPGAAAAYTPPVDTLIIITDFFTFPDPPESRKVGPGALFVWDNAPGDPNLFLVDPCTGLGIRVGTLDASPTTFLQGLAFDSSGNLFGLYDDLYSIDPTNAEVTPIGPLGFRAGAADFDPSENLYVVELNGEGSEVLGTVNLETGAASVIGTLSVDIGIIGSIVFDPGTETLLGSGFGGPLGNILFDLDPATATVSNIRYASIPLQGMGFATPCPSLVIDIKPGSDTNPVNLKSKGVIPVAILGSPVFDVSTVDCSTIAFGPAGASPVHRAGCHPEDVNGDFYQDLIVHFRTQEVGFGMGDTEGCLTALTLDGMELEGCDSIAIVPPMADQQRALFESRDD
jgi:hypothetical protein